MMRTVTFANEELSTEIDELTVPVWHNQDAFNELNPKTEHFQKFSSQTIPDENQVQAYPVGAGGRNMIAFFCDSSGRVVHYAEGYWPPKDFRKHLEFAIEQRKKLQELTSREQPTDAQTALNQQTAGLAQQLNQEIARIHENRNALLQRFPELEGATQPNALVSERAVKAFHEYSKMGLLLNSHQMATMWVGGTIEDVLVHTARSRMVSGAII